MVFDVGSVITFEIRKIVHAYIHTYTLVQLFLS